MKKIGLIGYPIEHSLSPEIFKEKFGENNPDYSYDLILKDNFEDAVSVFKNEYYAANVTAPFKEKAYEYAGILDINAGMAMAVNLLVKKDRLSVWGFNTDVYAVSNILSQIRKKTGYDFLRLCIIGTGGAGRAAAVAAMSAKDEMYLCNRTAKNISKFKKNIRREEYSYWKLVIDTCSLDKVKKVGKAIKDSDVIVYAVPHVETGSDAPSVIPGDADLSGKWIIEPNYKDPSFNEEDARERGYHYVSGKVWLRLQAEKAYKIIMGNE